MQTIAIVDYGMGNLGSVARALRHVAPQANVLVTSNPEQVVSADRVVFPGQGAMPDCMRYLHESGLSAAVREAARARPFLGVCMGEQMLLEASDEVAAGPDSPDQSAAAPEATPGLGIIAGRVKRLQACFDHLPQRLKVPHMGWNRVFQRQSHPVWQHIPEGAYFYFVHSYYAQPANITDVAAETEYGVRFTSALARDNIFATQFHPEKSATTGLRLYQNFVHWSP